MPLSKKVDYPVLSIPGPSGVGPGSSVNFAVSIGSANTSPYQQPGNASTLAVPNTWSSAAPKTFNLSVTNSGASYYAFNGQDRSTTHVDAFDPEINVNAGDTLVFSFNISGSHPFWIKTISNHGNW